MRHLFLKNLERKGCNQFKQVVQGPCGWRISAKFLANADQHQAWQQVVDRASHVALLGPRIRCAHAIPSQAASGISHAVEIMLRIASVL